MKMFTEQQIKELFQQAYLNQIKHLIDHKYGISFKNDDGLKKFIWSTCSYVIRPSDNSIRFYVFGEHLFRFNQIVGFLDNPDQKIISHDNPTKSIEDRKDKR